MVGTMEEERFARLNHCDSETSLLYLDDNVPFCPR
jgi:hypothetical protein